MSCVAEALENDAYNLVREKEINRTFSVARCPDSVVVFVFSVTKSIIRPYIKTVEVIIKGKTVFLFQLDPRCCVAQLQRASTAVQLPGKPSVTQTLLSCQPDVFLSVVPCVM